MTILLLLLLLLTETILGEKVMRDDGHGHNEPHDEPDTRSEPAPIIPLTIIYMSWMVAVVAAVATTRRGGCRCGRCAGAATNCGRRRRRPAAATAVATVIDRVINVIVVVVAIVAVTVVYATIILIGGSSDNNPPVHLPIPPAASFVLRDPAHDQAPPLLAVGRHSVLVLVVRVQELPLLLLPPVS